VPITGQDAELAAAIRIVQGQQGMTIFKDTRLLGKKAMEMSLEMAAGKTVETHGQTVNNNKKDVPAVLLVPFAVTKDNIDEQLIKSGYLKRAQVYKK
jgi:D-xylose transport system substrate-binding protein